MQRFHLARSFPIFPLFVLAALPVIAQNSNFDFQRIGIGTTAFTSASVLVSANGSLYAVGNIYSPASFQTTAGALRVQTSQPAIYVQKLNADGSVLASALVADCPYAAPVAAVDSAGNVYIAAAMHTIAGITGWTTGGETGVIKVGPQLDQVLYATHLFGFYTGPLSIDVDTDGSPLVALVGYQNIQTAKLDPSGKLSFNYTLTDFGTPGGIVYDGHWAGISVASDHSYWVAASPMFMYHVNAAGNQTTAHISLGSRNITLSALRTDQSGNVYAAGSAPTPLPVPATLVDYDQTNPMPHTVIFKFAPSGANLYTSSLAASSVSSLATDTSGNLWAAGGSYYGITLLELNTTGTKYLHYVTTPADAAAVSSLNLDASGRPLLAGSTNSLQLPDPLTPTNTTTFASTGGANAFLIRLKPILATADLKIALAAASPSVSTFGNVTYQATIANAGPAPAADVRIAVPGFVAGQTNVSDLLYSCHATGAGICVKTGSYWRIA